MTQSDTELIPDKFTLEVERLEDGTWVVTSPEIRGMILAHKELSKLFLPLETVATKLIRHNGLPETRPSPITEEEAQEALEAIAISKSHVYGCANNPNLTNFELKHEIIKHCAGLTGYISELRKALKAHTGETNEQN